MAKTGKISRNYFAFLVLIILSALSENLYAFSIPNWFSDQPIHPVLALAAGNAYTLNIGESKNFPIQNPLTSEFYFYSANKQTQPTFFWDMFVGGEWLYRAPWSIQAGLDYNQSSQLTSKGMFTQGADIISEDFYTYQYDIVTRQLLLQGKMLYTYKERFHPYVLAGVGASFNTACHYSTNVPLTLTFTRQYASHTSSSFSYALGLGVDADLTDHLRLGVGYRFTDLGQAQLGNAIINVTSVPGTLSQSHLYTNEVLVQLSALF